MSVSAAQSLLAPAGALNAVMTMPTWPLRSMTTRRGPSCFGSIVSTVGIGMGAAGTAP